VQRTFGWPTFPRGAPSPLGSSDTNGPGRRAEAFFVLLNSVVHADIADDLLRQGQLPADGTNKSTAPLKELSISGAVEKKRDPKKGANWVSQMTPEQRLWDRRSAI
jgi:hypothetical protein